MRYLIAITLMLMGLGDIANANCFVPRWRMVWDTEGAIDMTTDGAACRTSISRVWNTSEVHSVRIASAPRNGTASATGRSVIYRPRSGFKGGDSFVFAVAGRKAGNPTRATMRVNITVR